MNRKRPYVDFIELHILHHAGEGSVYGLWMIEELANHGYRLSASNLYPRFHRLEKNGLVRRKDVVVDGKLRKYYRITSAGRKYLKEQKRRVMELVSEAFSPEELRQALDGRSGRARQR